MTLDSIGAMLEGIVANLKGVKGNVYVYESFWKCFHASCPYVDQRGLSMPSSMSVKSVSQYCDLTNGQMQMMKLFDALQEDKEAQDLQRRIQEGIAKKRMEAALKVLKMIYFHNVTCNALTKKPSYV